MKTILEITERILSVFLSVCACMGMFLIGCFAVNLLCDELSTEAMWAIFLASVILIYGATQLLWEVRYRKLEILADELEFQKDEQAQELYEHLRMH